MKRLSTFLTERPRWMFGLVIAGIALLPVSVWLDLNSMSHHNLHRQATSLNALMDGFRGYYASNVAARVRAFDGTSTLSHDYHDIDGAIPIPATLSLEMGTVIADKQRGVEYRFVSDFPFKGRTAHVLNAFEQQALDAFRDPAETRSHILQESGNLLDHRISMATPVLMEPSCVSCHNSHPQSPKTDWQVGEVRGLQVVNVKQPIVMNLFSFKFLLTYLVISGTFGILFAMHQLRLANRFRRMNDELAENNEFLASISLKISKYLSPQVYRSIFSGEKDVAISTERKKLTVFFSDIKDFTAATEQMQPEELTALLNEYFTEMSQIAESHGGTIDKFIGDAIVAFFGDPTTRGTKEDARACVRMALEMQQRLSELETVWRDKGLEHPFRARMGINTGYCNVGNFGSDARMDYTIIGAEANLAARLESIAEPGGIVMSYETYAHVRDMIEGEPLEPQRVKGISREITPYKVLNKAIIDDAVTAHTDGERLVVDMKGVDEATRQEISAAINATLAARRPKPE
ncbi:adenylate/guanylate cyclase domain-containing protein [Shimia abyssi]|uniref:Class 3 adenylate cyclase n=1 Tax=Shimia abyssi TaxID=1662395 RepID=A0A2P8FJQ9_9RHOB|nr:adenylate/guanylate cyclase domain-containing protein [Shimia abyssi]PSL21909.1 class 3 adenylate cyclase [Shimia abyssi]